MRQRIESTIAEEGVGGMAAWTVLVHVMLREGCSQAQLAADAGIAESTLARHLDRMVAHGLVERVPDPDDGRRQQVRSTARGRAAQASFRQRTIAGGERMLAGISSEDRQVVRRVFAGIRNNLDRDGERIMSDATTASAALVRPAGSGESIPLGFAPPHPTVRVMLAAGDGVGLGIVEYGVRGLLRGHAGCRPQRRGDR